MGYYINHDSKGLTLPSIGKAKHLIEIGDAKNIFKAPDKLPENGALICVVENPLFDAAAYCYSELELEMFKEDDGRAKHWLVMDIELVKKLTGYKE